MCVPDTHVDGYLLVLLIAAPRLRLELCARVCECAYMFSVPRMLFADHIIIRVLCACAFII